ncbi:hypothetical protein M5D96_012117, partial [Drosophila gunungcola]
MVPSRCVLFVRVRSPPIYRSTLLPLPYEGPMSSVVPLIHGVSALPGSKVRCLPFDLVALDSSGILASFAV